MSYTLRLAACVFNVMMLFDLITSLSHRPIFNLFHDVLFLPEKTRFRPVGDVFVYKGIEGRSLGYFGSVSVCKSTICRKLKETNETVAHERPQTRAQSMENSDKGL